MKCAEHRPEKQKAFNFMIDAAVSSSRAFEARGGRLPGASIRSLGALRKAPGGGAGQLLEPREGRPAARGALLLLLQRRLPLGAGGRDAASARAAKRGRPGRCANLLLVNKGTAAAPLLHTRGGKLLLRLLLGDFASVVAPRATPPALLGVGSSRSCRPTAPRFEVIEVGCEGADKRTEGLRREAVRRTPSASAPLAAPCGSQKGVHCYGGRTDARCHQERRERRKKKLCTAHDAGCSSHASRERQGLCRKKDANGSGKAH